MKTFPLDKETLYGPPSTVSHRSQRHKASSNGSWIYSSNSSGSSSQASSAGSETVARNLFAPFEKLRLAGSVFGNTIVTACPSKTESGVSNVAFGLSLAYALLVLAVCVWFDVTIARDMVAFGRIDLSPYCVNMIACLLWSGSATLSQLINIVYYKRVVTYVGILAAAARLKADFVGLDDTAALRRAGRHCLLAYLLMPPFATAVIFAQTAGVSFAQLPYTVNLFGPTQAAYVIPVSLVAMYLVVSASMYLAVQYYMFCFTTAHFFDELRSSLVAVEFGCADTLRQFVVVLLGATWHQAVFHKLSEANALLNDMYKLYNLIVLFVGIALQTLLAYVIIYTNSSYPMLFWMCNSALVVGMAAAPAILLNDAGENLKEAIGQLEFSMPARLQHTDIRVQLLSFLNQVATANIGVTVADAFVMDRNTIISMASTIVTYLILMLQTAPARSSETITTDRNATDIS